MFTAITTHSLVFASITQLVEYFLGKEEVVRSNRIGSSRPILYCLKRAGTIQWPHRRTRDGGDAFNNRNHLMETNSGTPSRRLMPRVCEWLDPLQCYITSARLWYQNERIKQNPGTLWNTNSLVMVRGWFRVPPKMKIIHHKLPAPLQVSVPRSKYGWDCPKGNFDRFPINL